MVVIYTRKDVYDSTTMNNIDDSCVNFTKSTSPPISVLADTILYIGNSVHRTKKRAKYLRENKKEPIDRIMTPEGAITHLIRQLNHEQEIETDFVSLILHLARSLNSKEITELIPKLEEMGFDKL